MGIQHCLLSLPFGTPQRYASNVEAIWNELLGTVTMYELHECWSALTLTRSLPGRPQCQCVHCGHLDCSAFSGRLLRNIGAQSMPLIGVPGSGHSSLSTAGEMNMDEIENGATRRGVHVPRFWPARAHLSLALFPSLRLASQVLHSTPHNDRCCGWGSIPDASLQLVSTDSADLLDSNINP